MLNLIKLISLDTLHKTQNIDKACYVLPQCLQMVLVQSFDAKRKKETSITVSINGSNTLLTNWLSCKTRSARKEMWWNFSFQTKKNNGKLSKGDDEVMIVQSCLERWKFCKDETGTKFGAVEEEGHKFCVKSRDGIFDTTAAPSHYTVRWVSLQWRRSRTCEATKLISAAKVCDNLSTSFSPHKSVFL